MYLSELARNAARLDPLELMSECVEENAEYIADLNTSQLSKGKTSKNENISPEYQFAEYAKMKKAIGSDAPFGVPNLKLEGNFYEGFIAEPLKSDKGGIFITSTDSKAPKLAVKYGTDIFGLTDQSRGDLKTVLLPTLINKIKNGLSGT